jgi:hypothetical protein
MIPLILNAYARNLALLRKLVADVDDAAMTLQPVAGMNHPAWIIGHLAWASDRGAELMNLKPRLPGEWAGRFGTGSTPVPEHNAYPEKTALVEALEEVHTRFAAALPAVPSESYNSPMPENLRAIVPTVGDALIHLATSHEALHIGQLSAWRRARGLPPIPLF